MSDPPPRSRIVAVLLAAVTYGLVHLLGRTSGSTRSERARACPGDDLVPRPNVVTNHAVTIAAPPAEIWPWLTQMGWHRAGWYTPRWVDRVFFPANWPSSSALDPALVRDLAVGDTIPDGAPGTAFFVVEEASPPDVLVLHSTTHLPASWRDRWGAAIDWTWCFALTELESGRTRVQLRVRGRTRPWWLTAAYVGALVPADAVMAPGLLHGLRRRVEAASTGTPATAFTRPGRSPRRFPASPRRRGGGSAPTASPRARR
jgi:hypothetical protein